MAPPARVRSCICPIINTSLHRVLSGMGCQRKQLLLRRRGPTIRQPTLLGSSGGALADLPCSPESPPYHSDDGRCSATDPASCCQLDRHLPGAADANVRLAVAGEAKLFFRLGFLGFRV